MSTQIGHLTLEQARAQLAAPLPNRPAAISADEYARLRARVIG